MRPLTMQKKIMKGFPLLLPFILVLSGVYVLEYFGRKRMGMMRYLVFIKREFDNGWFQPLILWSLAALASILMGFILWQLFKKPHQKKLLIYWLACLLTLDLWLFFPQARALKSFHFGLMGWLVLGVSVTLYSLWQLRRQHN